MKHTLFVLVITIFVYSCKNDRKFPPVKNVNELEETDFIPTFEHKLDKNKNQVYCSTIGYAWNEVKEAVNGEIKIDQKFSDLLLLNTSGKFENTLAEDEIDNSVSVSGGRIEARSSFNKSLPFELEFVRNNYGLTFDNNEGQVESFGMYGSNADLYSQIEILYYENANEFAIKLKPKVLEHEIMLIMSKAIKPISFDKMLKSFKNKADRHSKLKEKGKSHWRYYLDMEDVIRIPVLEFNLEKSYESIKGNSFFVKDKKFDIEVAYQRIALILDEKGAEIESETMFDAVTEEEMIEDLPKPKKMIFDKPFLIIFKRVDAEYPYLIAWIANTELMSER